MDQKEKQRLIQELKVTAEDCPYQLKGGQQVSMSPRGIRVEHEEVGIAIFVGYFRNYMENKAAAILLFEQALDLLK